MKRKYGFISVLLILLLAVSCSLENVPEKTPPAEDTETEQQETEKEDPDDILATPQNVLKTLSATHEYGKSTRTIVESNATNSPMITYYMAILSNDISRLDGLEFGETFTDFSALDWSDLTVALFQNGKMEGGTPDEIREVLTGMLKFGAVRVEKLDGDHAKVYFELTFGSGTPTYTVVECTRNGLGFFDTELLSWDRNNLGISSEGYTYEKKVWSPLRHDDWMLSHVYANPDAKKEGEMSDQDFAEYTKEREIVSSHVTLDINGRTAVQYVEDPEKTGYDEFIHHGERQKEMQKDVLAWKDREASK